MLFNIIFSVMFVEAEREAVDEDEPVTRPERPPPVAQKPVSSMVLFHFFFFFFFFLCELLNHTLFYYNLKKNFDSFQFWLHKLQADLSKLCVWIIFSFTTEKKVHCKMHSFAVKNMKSLSVLWLILQISFTKYLIVISR